MGVSVCVWGGGGRRWGWGRGVLGGGFLEKVPRTISTGDRKPICFVPCRSLARSIMPAQSGHSVNI